MITPKQKKKKQKKEQQRFSTGGTYRRFRNVRLSGRDGTHIMKP